MNHTKVVIKGEGTLELGEKYSDQVRVLGVNFRYFYFLTRIMFHTRKHENITICNNQL